MGVGASHADPRPETARAMSDRPPKRSMGWQTAIRIVVLLLILLSAILVQAGSGGSLRISFLYGAERRPPSCSGSSTGPSDGTSRRASAAHIQLLGDLAIVTVLVYPPAAPTRSSTSSTSS